MPKNEINIRLCNVRELTSSTKFHKWKIYKYKGTPIKVDISASLLPNLNDNSITLTLGAIYVQESEIPDDYYLKYFIELKYEIEKLNEIVEQNEISITIPSYILSIMMSVGIGTLRGMLTKSLESTNLRNYPLPILNITEIISTLHLHKYQKPSSYPIFNFIYE